jgi:hypothetical protein
VCEISNVHGCVVPAVDFSTSVVAPSASAPPPPAPAHPSSPSPRASSTSVTDQLRAVAALRGKINLVEGRRRSAARAALPSSDFSPAHARFWSSLPFSDFLPEFGTYVRAGGSLQMDRAAWSSAFSHAFTPKTFDLADLDSSEDKVIASGSPFGARLHELRSEFSDWPFVTGNLDVPAWLRILSDDPDPAAAQVYFTISRGFAVLSPELAAAFPATRTDNYGSSAEHAAEVDIEITRLLSQGFIAPWGDIVSERGLPADTQPTVILAIGAVVRKGKVRIVIDGSAPRGASVNDAIEPPPTVLPNIFMAMAAMTHRGYGWKSDYTDAFLQHVLQPSSVPLCVISWRGDLFGYRRLGFGFKSGPSQQQSTTLSVVRAMMRRLRAAGLGTASPPALDHSYPRIHAAAEGTQRLNAALAFLDDVGGFSASLPAAWFSFSAYLVLCLELSLGVAFKAGKTDVPTQMLHFLGFDCDFVRMVVSLHPERVADLRMTLHRIATAPQVMVGDLLSLVGVLVFCSVVIKIGKVHYRALIDVITAMGPRPRASSPVRIGAAVRDSLATWDLLLSLLNARSAQAPVLRPTVPGEATTDASLTGWAWEGMGLFEHDAWPSDWQGRLGRATSELPTLVAGLRRVFICECELWAVVFLVRRLAPRCVSCRLIVRVDNKPVVSMLNRMSTRSAACLPLLKEVCWVCACYDVELDVRWIDTKSNLIADTLSRKFSPDHDEALYNRVVRQYLRGPASDPEWRSWPPQRAARPELEPHIPVAAPADFSSAWANLDAKEMTRIIPFYLQKVDDRRDAAGQ